MQKWENKENKVFCSGSVELVSGKYVEIENLSLSLFFIALIDGSIRWNKLYVYLPNYEVGI